MSNPHWHILGAGAMGCLFGAMMKEGGCEVTLLLRTGSSHRMTRFTVEDDAGRRQYEVNISTPPDPEPIDFLLVTTKAYDVVSAVETVSERLHPGTTVLLLSNGMGFEATLRQQFPQLDIYSGTTTEGAFGLSPWVIRHAGRGSTRIGKPGRHSAPNWLSSFVTAVPGASWEPQIEQALWQKLAINCAINPLTAVHRCLNGELLNDPMLAAEVENLCGEIEQVTAAAGFEVTGDELQGIVNSVIQGTASNRSSMLQDVLAGRQTEIDFITGHLLQVASAHALQTPCNTLLYKQLKALELHG